MKTVFVILSSLFIFTGCLSDNSIETQKEECLAQNKKFFTTKALNYRSGKYEMKGICK